MIEKIIPSVYNERDAGADAFFGVPGGRANEIF